MQREVLEKIPHSDVRVYAVWVPILRTDVKLSVPQATKRFTDARVSHYWDGEGNLVKGYARTLEIDGPAWDIYLLYGRDAEWKQEAPAPTFWMDQLGLEKGTPFDGGKLAESVKQLLDAPAAK